MALPGCPLDRLRYLSWHRRSHETARVRHAAHAQKLEDKSARIGILRKALDDPIAVRIDQDAAQLFAQTAALARSNVQLLVTEGTEAALQAATAASQSTPIVMWANNFDPIRRGYVMGLASPGGNVIGIVSQQTELAASS